ncbi:MAG: hypothetical protein GOMPHAMPRED_002583 [Gomphillus americanus]|uniref:Uncharacterized protein n=1 Tax=Gomphillus americanus TaxID=1940652 RepID=A0A8H3FDA4_9LECA|nr:MAG: hypothetical protein GOMPHAMPRED_002583 [Gomphillus americanus]
MSFFHQTSAGTARVRRTKERDGHSRASSVNNSGRRHGASSKNQDNRSPPSKSPVLQGSIYSQQNLMLNQPQGAFSSETSQPAPVSPTSSIQVSNNHRGGVIHLSQQPYTPIALQKYLDEDQSSDDDNEEHREGDSQDEKRVGRLSDAAIEVAETKSTIIEKPQSRAHLDQKESPKSTTRDLGNSLYKVNSAHRAGRLESSNPHKKPVSDITRNMAPQKDPGTSVQQLSKEDESNTGISMENVMQVESDKFTEYGSKPASKRSSNGMTLAASIELQRRSLSQQTTNSMDANAASHENIELQAVMMRGASQQSAPFASRTFTPPAPPLGISRAPAKPSPVFMSPIPIRSRATGDSYTAPYAPPPHYQQYQPSNTLNPENYSGHPVFQDFAEFSPMPYPLHPTMYANIHNAPQSALAEVQVTQQYPQGEQDNSPLILISKLLSALPELQMFIAQCQQSGMDNGYNLLGSHDSEQQNDRNIKCQVLEEKVKKDEQRHKEEITALSGQLADLQIRLRYVESDLADSKKSRDELYEELVMQRIESASTIKLLSNEKDDLQRRCDDAYTMAEEEAQEQLLVLRREIDKEKNQSKELELQIKQLRASYEVQVQETSCAFDQKYNELVESHKQALQSLEAQLNKEFVRGSTLARQVKELDQKLDDERKCLTTQFDHDKKMMANTFEEKAASLRGEIRVENTRTNRSMEENTKLAKELDNARQVAASDRTRFQEIAQRFQDAVCKMNQENVRWRDHSKDPGRLTATDKPAENRGSLRSYGC